MYEAVVYANTHLGKEVLFLGCYISLGLVNRQKAEVPQLQKSN